MKDLRDRTARGAAARVGAQVANFALRLVSLSILARLLSPNDFGLVGMVTALTGVLSLFRDFGLSAASVQRASVTDAQKTALFWLNILFGTVLAVLTTAVAPVIARFYHEPRLMSVAVVIGSTFLINAAGIQHSALLQRELRFTTLSVIDTGSWVLSTAVAIVTAEAGYGYWALVAMTVTLPIAGTTAFWIASGWRAGGPQQVLQGIKSMLRFGGTITLNGLIVYIASNFEKVLLGRYWGADAIGIYGRAYQLIRIPTDTINGAIGEVAFSALSQLQDDSVRLRSYFLKGYSLVLALTLPATFACCIFANDLIAVVLGAKWKDAGPIFRLLTPTILVFAIANPLSWLLGAVGMSGAGRENVTCDCAVADWRVLSGIAARAEGRCYRLFHRDGALVGAGGLVVCAGDRSFLQGCRPRGEPAADFERGRRCCCRRPVRLVRRVPSGEIDSGRDGSGCVLCRDAVLRDGAAGVLCSNSSAICPAPASRRRGARFQLANFRMKFSEQRWRGVRDRGRGEEAMNGDFLPALGASRNSKRMVLKPSWCNATSRSTHSGERCEECISRSHRILRQSWFVAHRVRSTMLQSIFDPIHRHSGNGSEPS